MIIKITEDNIGQRIDGFLSKHFNLSRKCVTDKIESGYIKINNIETTKNGYKLKSCDIVEILGAFFDIDEFSIADIQPYNIPLDIIYQDNDIIIINKQAGLTTHPGVGNPDKTLVNALIHHFSCAKLSDIAGIERLGIVHRLDKDTSGLMVIAKNNKVHAILSEEIKNKDNFHRTYIALCYGIFMPTSGVIEKWMKKGSFSDGRMIICNESDSNAKYSKTEYKTIRVLKNQNITLMEFKLSTGRTHQIRLHSSTLKHFIIGDNIYGEIDINKKFGANRQMLHSYRLSFKHPITNKQMSFEAPIPEDMNVIINRIS